MSRVLDSYLTVRTVEFPAKNGQMATLRVERGVPQGSVLDPTLWNVAFDDVLRLPEGVGLLCYADDTLLYAMGSDLRSR